MRTEKITLQQPHLPSQDVKDFTGPRSAAFQRLCFRILDITIASGCLIAFSPLFLIVPVLIKLVAPGRVFFLQKRLGQGGKPFLLLKFRTMVENQERGRWTVKDDPRITRVGGFLRKFHLDEIPQFLNVILGDMSIVGPRPYTAAIHSRLCRIIPEFSQRLRFKPGVTGWSQLVGRIKENNLDHHAYLFTVFDQRYLTSPLTVATYLQLVSRTVAYLLSEAVHRTF